MIRIQTIQSPGNARQLARRILAQRRFQPEKSPQPLRRPITWIGEKLNDIVGPLFRPFLRMGWLVAVVAVIALVAVVAFATYVGRGRIQSHQDRRLLEAGPEVDPATLDAAANRAVTAGDHELALRLRFKAGLIRLERAGRIAPSLGRTNGDVRRQLSSQSFESLADRFDEVIYGGDPATEADDERTRTGWRDVLSGDRS